jgi:hypothetical protein
MLSYLIDSVQSVLLRQIFILLKVWVRCGTVYKLNLLKIPLNLQKRKKPPKESSYFLVF